MTCLSSVNGNMGWSLVIYLFYFFVSAVSAHATAQNSPTDKKYTREWLKTWNETWIFWVYAVCSTIPGCKGGSCQIIYWRRLGERKGEKNLWNDTGKNPQHRHEGLGTMLRKILEAQDRNGGLGAMLKTILEAAEFLLLVFFVVLPSYHSRVLLDSSLQEPL